MAKPTFRQYPILEEFECTCKFYTSTTKENGITGTLTYQHNRGIFINLMNPIAFTDGMILYAESTDLNYFTFYNVTRRLELIEEDDDETHDDKNKLLNAEYMLMSATSSSFPQNNAFDRIGFELVDLWEWYPTRRKRHLIRKSQTRKAVSLSIMPEFSITTKNAKTITFHNEPIDTLTFKGAKLEYKPEVIIKYSDKRPFEDLMSSAQNFRTLFQLLTASYGAFTEIIIFNEKQKYRVYLVDENSEMNLKWGAGSIFLHFSKIKRTLTKILNNWDNLHNEIKQVIDILIMEHNNYSLNSEVRFLNVSRAIETFHRKLRLNREKDQELLLLIRNLKKGIPEKYKDKFDNSLSFIHEPTLRDRITQLSSEFKKETRQRLNIDKDWITRVVKSRNYYTHFGEMSKGVQTDENLRTLSNEVRTLLYLLVAKELGVTERTLVEGLWYLILV